jgi:hypothetical protein
MHDTAGDGIDIKTGCLLSAAWCLAAYALGHGWGLLERFVVNDDVRQQLFWMQRWADPSLYPDYTLFDYARQYVPWGVQAVYFLGSQFVPVLSFSKMLAGMLYVGSGVLFHLIGRRVAGRDAGWTVLAVYLLMPAFLYNISGGLARAFATPTLALFIYGRIVGSWRLSNTALLIQAFCIPYMFLLCGLAAALDLARDSVTRLHPAKPLLIRFSILALGATAVLAWKWSFSGSGFGPLATGNLLSLPEFGPQGRFQVLPSPLWDLVEKPFSFIGFFREAGTMWGYASLAAIIIGAILGGMQFTWQRARPLLSPLGSLLTASILLYAAAHMFALRLFVPGRYVEYTINATLCLGLGFCLHGMVARRPLSRTALIMLLAVATLLGASRLSQVGLSDYSADADLYAAVWKTPDDALFAGHPAVMDNVLTFGRRKVLASQELAHPWSVGLWERLKPTIADMLAAYYAVDKNTVMDFCRKYNVTHLVVDDRHFTAGYLDRSPFFAPFDDQIRRLTSEGGPFIVLQPDVFPGISVGPHTRIIEVDKARSQQ